MLKSNNVGNNTEYSVDIESCILGNCFVVYSLRSDKRKMCIICINDIYSFVRTDDSTFSAHKGSMETCVIMYEPNSLH